MAEIETKGVKGIGPPKLVVEQGSVEIAVVCGCPLPFKTGQRFPGQASLAWMAYVQGLAYKRSES